MKLLRDLKIQVLLIALFFCGLVIGMIIPIIFNNNDSTDTFGNRALLIGDPLDNTKLEIPLVTAIAGNLGWIDPFLCSPGRGRYFSNDDFPNLFLLYNNSEQLFGFYFSSDKQMPLPWKNISTLTGPGGTQIVNNQHWGLYALINDPLEACKSPDSDDAVGTGIGYASGSSVRSYSTQSTPTATPEPDQVLKDILYAISSDDRNFVISHDPDETLVAENIESRLLHDTLSGMINIQDGPSKWINNISYKGLMGDLNAEYLKNILKSSNGDVLKISVWFNEDKQISFIQITGPITNGNEQFSKLNIQPK